MSHNSNPQKHKSRKEIVAEMARKKENARKREILVNQFYPALGEATVSVDEAKALLHAMSSLVMEEGLRAMKERKFSEVIEPVMKVLCQDGERETEIKALLETCKDESMYITREIIEGVTRAIDTMVNKDMKNRKLATLDPEWDKYLN